MKQPHAHITFLFVTLGIVAILLLLTDMATGDTFIPISKLMAERFDWPTLIYWASAPEQA
jgi:hypothetical protein